MRGLPIRLALLFCVSTALVLLTGCPKQEVEQVETEPAPPEPEPEPEPTPPPPPPVDPRAWYSEMNDVFFDFDKYELRADARATLQANAGLLKENSNWTTLVLEGHCDERGTEDYNMALGERRASAVLDYLKDLGVTASKVKTISYGEEKPFAMGSTESAWAQNRRVHFRFE